MIVLDQSKIDNLVSSYDDTERKVICAGSDEHLDIILLIQDDIKQLIELSVQVNEELESTFNDLDAKQAKDIVIKLSVGVNKAKHFIYFLKGLPNSIFEGIKSCFKDLIAETKQIDEFLQDLIKYKVNDPEELKKLLNEIK